MQAISFRLLCLCLQKPHPPVVLTLCLLGVANHKRVGLKGGGMKLDSFPFIFYTQRMEEKRKDGVGDK